MIHGLGDDRNLTLVNGVPVSAACPMHMNPPLSYIDPANVAHDGSTARRHAGEPGRRQHRRHHPGGIRAAGVRCEDAALERKASVSSFYRSNGAALGGTAAAAIASSDLSFAYQGAGGRAGDYRDGEGQRINASGFETPNQQITAAYRSGQDLYQAQAALQYMPYEGFPNGGHGSVRQRRRVHQCALPGRP